MPRLLLVCVAVASAAHAAPLKLAAPGLTVVGLPADRAEFFSEHLAGRLTSAGAQVTTGKAIEQLLGLERQKQLLGCNEAKTSCVVELANALGTDGIVFGEIAKVGDTYQVNVKVLAADTARIVANVQQRAKREDDVLDALDVAGVALARDSAAALGRQLAGDTARAVPLSARRWGALGVASLGVAAGVTSAALFAAASAKAAELPTTANGKPPLPLAQAQALTSEGATLQTVAWVSAGVAVAGLGAAGVLFWTGGDGTAVAVVPGPSSVNVVGRF